MAWEESLRWTSLLQCLQSPGKLTAGSVQRLSPSRRPSERPVSHRLPTRGCWTSLTRSAYTEELHIEHAKNWVMFSKNPTNSKMLTVGWNTDWTKQSLAMGQIWSARSPSSAIWSKGAPGKGCLFPGESDFSVKSSREPQTFSSHHTCRAHWTLFSRKHNEQTIKCSSLDFFITQIQYLIILLFS